MAYGLGRSFSRVIVKDWFRDKLNTENNKALYGRSVFAIFKETEKAVYAMVADGADYIISWIPKKCIERVPSNYARWATFEGGISVENAIKAWEKEVNKQGL